MEGIRVRESSTEDVYVNVNDLIIELMVELGKTSTDAERSAINKIISRLTRIRDASHGNATKI
jgi:hypothetical protein